MDNIAIIKSNNSSLLNQSNQYDIVILDDKCIIIKK